VVNVAFHGGSCGAACTDITSPACSCTQSNYYWSASSSPPSPSSAWIVDFSHGYVGGVNKAYNFYVRAVRSGL